MKSLKLLSGFDGIWTNQEKEAEYVWDTIHKKLRQVTKFSESEIKNIFDEAESDMNRTPYENGWMNEEKISAFRGEDPFGDIYALFGYIDKTANTKSFSVYKQKLAEIKKDINNKYKSPEKFAFECFTEASRKFKESGKLAPPANAKASLEKVLDKGADVVIASNSGTEKIEHLFLKLGKSPTNEKSFKRNNVFARSNARKFVISPDYKMLPETMNIKKYYDIQLRRKFYHKVLTDEMPDFVLGNIFSIEIALPLYLRQSEPGFKNLKVIQLIKKYTPGWVKDYLSKDEFKGIAYMINDIKELPDVVNWS